MGALFFKVVDILSYFSHSCLFHSASFELVLFLEEVTLRFCTSPHFKVRRFLTLNWPTILATKLFQLS